MATAMSTVKLLVVALWTSASVTARGSSSATPPTVFTAPASFPTSVFGSYFNDPTATSAQVQPVITDPVSHLVYPLSLTDPNTLPANDTIDPHPLPPTANGSALLSTALQMIANIISNPGIPDDCAKCQAGLGVAQFLALAAPAQVPNLAVTLCETLGLSSDEGCLAEFSILSEGNIIAQVLQKADVAGVDGQTICQVFAGLCPTPAVSPLNLTSWFAKPKPNPLPAPKTPSGERLKVLHLSDFHLDPRYATGTEANCTDGNLCCRTDATNQTGPLTPLLPAPRFGSFLCDTPYTLALSALEAVPVLTGTEDTGFNFTIYTGDLVSHDPFNQLSRNYTLYAETVIYGLFKQLLGSGPVYPTLGNHDSYPTAQDAPHNLGGDLGTQFSWNYDHVASLWEEKGWIDGAAASLAKAHYAAYSVQRQDGLRIITLNTDFWYNQNLFNYINLTSSDNSGALRFLTDELQDAEDASDRVWIMGHVPTGTPSETLLNPSNLFYQIVDRFSPHVIAAIFFGHTHEDAVEIFYTNNGTVMNDTTAQTVAWIGPSITPLTDLNVGLRMYEIDSATFDILDAFTWFANVSTFPAIDELALGPTFELEYSTRETYGAGVQGWGPNDPLNATWWQRVTELMETNQSLVNDFNTFQTKSSQFTTPCTGACATALICGIRSGSAVLSAVNC